MYKDEIFDINWILVGVLYDEIIPIYIEGLAPINEVKEVLIHIRLKIVHRYRECASLQIAKNLVWVYAFCYCPILGFFAYVH